MEEMEELASVGRSTFREVDLMGEMEEMGVMW